MVENKRMPTKKPKMQAVTKLRSRSSARSKNGWAVVMVWITKTHRPAPARIASVQISRDWNQSWLGPRSSTIWAAAMNRVSMPKPRKSNFLAALSRSPEMNNRTPRKARMPIGRLM